MKWLPLFLATTAFANENDAELHSRLLGGNEQGALTTETALNRPVDLGDINPLETPSSNAAASVLPPMSLGGLWPFFAVIGLGGVAIVMRKKGMAIPGLSKPTVTPKVPMKVISRNSLGGNACILLVDVQGADGEVRRLLLGTGGNATPTLVQDLGIQGQKTSSSTAEVPERLEFKTILDSQQATSAAPSTQMRANKQVVDERSVPRVAPANTPDYPEMEYNPEGVEPGSDPLHTRLRRVHRHRSPGARSAVKTAADAKANGNWRVNSFASGMSPDEAMPLDDGITVRVSSSKSHLESFAAKNTSNVESNPTARIQKTEDDGERKRLDVSNAFEAELRRRVYDSSPGERKKRSDAAKALVDQMIQERLSQARTA